jgi:exonuclease SbcD
VLIPTVGLVRFLHTSDWHLGRRFHQVGLLAAQAAYLDHLVDTARTEQVDAVLVSGDVYDRALPSPEAVALLSDALTRLVDTGAHVVVTSGNHDSATRLGFGGSLLERSGLHLRTTLADLDRPIVVKDTAVFGLPYLEPRLVARPLGLTDVTHAQALREAMSRVRVAAESVGTRHTVVMAHAFVTGCASSDSERDISVGGVCAVPAEVFDGVSYAALGHLHGRQQVGDRVRYSGSPVAMSFGESGHVKGDWLIDLTGDTVRGEVVGAPVERPLAVLRGTIEDLLHDPRHVTAETAYCQITLTDPVRPLGAMERLRRRFPHTLNLLFDPEGVATTRSPYAARVAAQSDLDVCCDFVWHVRGGAAADPAERALLLEALDGSRVERIGREDEGALSVSRAEGAA